MAKVKVTKTWTITPNVRNAYVSLVSMMGWWLYQNKLAMTTAGWTVVFSCDGTTGPTNSSDTTDRWASSANCQTRATSAAAAQSWIVLANADGVQVLFAFQGASDDICRVSMSQGALFTLAGTTTNQPTATDELIITNGTTVINATTSADRVMSIGCTTESWWSACFRAGAITLYLSVDKIDSACDTTTLAKPYVGAKLTNIQTGVSVGSPLGGHSSGFAQTSASWFGVATRVVTVGTNRIIRVGGGCRCAPMVPGASGLQQLSAGPGDYSAWAAMPNGYTVATTPALNGGGVPVLTIDWFGEKSTNCDGYLGSPIDWWYAHTAGASFPTTADMIAALAVADTQSSSLRSNWLVCIGSAVIRPWLNAAATLQIT